METEKNIVKLFEDLIRWRDRAFYEADDDGWAYEAVLSRMKSLFPSLPAIPTRKFA